MKNFGDSIKKESDKKECTQTDLGTKIRININAISRIENGNQKYSKPKLEELAEIFQTNFQDATDLFFADKFFKEAIKYNSSQSVFSVAEITANYYRNNNFKHGKFEL